MSDPDDAPPGEPLRLDHFLKLAGAVESGGQAKQLIQNGEVLLNGQVETRRRKKLAPGDQVTIAGQTFTVPADPAAE